MFRKVLIANRGEIAVRIIRACRELGIRTVAVFSEADRNALHVRRADEAYCIGPAPARDSYLRIDRIIEAARRANADAIHPGYGFLAERPDFAEACEEAGIVFIGPPSRIIKAMGDKSTARKVAESLGIPVVPGTEGGLSDEELMHAAQTIGFPVFIKASAGGGGKGMRIVSSPKEMPDALAAARREAMAAFGDDDVYLEKLVKDARHVEIQILADQYGNVIHLGERECSIQRRHQKLIEESPSPIVDEEMRRRMGEVAVRIAKAIGYVNAGTVEFIVDKDRNFYFIEMNTRLQVEHPVTEMVTGVDIVKEQLRIARGWKLRYRQEDIRQIGWAIECRITAEDPFNGFMPSTGRIVTLTEPTGPGVRVDSGVYEGCEITPYYDSLIAKVITWGETRGEAILRMRRALEEFRIVGIQTTIPFHQAILNSTHFLAGYFDTKFVEERFSMGEETPQDLEEVAAIIATLVAHQRSRTTTHVVQRTVREISGWKWAGRWEQLRRGG